jgi:hypothetical protein
MGQRGVASAVTATTDFLGPDILNRYGRAVPSPSDAPHSTLLTMFPIAEGRHRQADPPLI